MIEWPTTFQALGNLPRKPGPERKPVAIYSFGSGTEAALRSYIETAMLEMSKLVRTTEAANK